MFQFDHGENAAKKKFNISDGPHQRWEKTEKELRDNIEDIKCAWCHGGDQGSALPRNATWFREIKGA